MSSKVFADLSQLNLHLHPLSCNFIFDYLSYELSLI